MSRRARSNGLWLPCALSLLATAACIDEAHHLGGGVDAARQPADAAGGDASWPDAAPIELRPEPGPPLTMHHLSLRGTFQSYHLREERFLPIDDFEHADFPIQLGSQGIRGLHFNIDYNNSRVFEVYNYGLIDQASRCRGSIRHCFESIGPWSRANPLHAPIVVVFVEPEGLLMEGFYGVLDVLHTTILREIRRDQIFTMDDLRAYQPGLTIREIVTQNLWPPLDEMRGKFIFLIGDPRARENQRDLSWNLDQEPELLLWLYADGHSDDELAADDAAIAILGPLEGADDVARAEEVIDRGFLTWTVAHDAETYGRASAAGVHIIASKYPDDLFPPPGAADWPVGCNPRTAPEGCRPRQIENRVAP